MLVISFFGLRSFITKQYLVVTHVTGSKSKLESDPFTKLFILISFGVWSIILSLKFSLDSLSNPHTTYGTTYQNNKKSNTTVLQ